MAKTAKPADNLETAARQLIEQARKQLLRDMPELLPVIYLMKEAPTKEPGPLCSDGLTLYYHPEQVARDYLADRGAIAAQMLHVLCHGLQGHFERRRGQAAAIFDAAADIAAADLAERLDSRYATPLDPETAERWPGGADSIYLSAQTKEEARALVKAAEPLRSDDHSLWDRPPREADGGAQGRRALAEMVRKVWGNAVAQVAGALSRAGKGDTAGMMSEVYRETEGSTVSYKDFLRRFCTLREHSAVDPDSFDRIWYRLGLDLTGDTPLVEPDELREERRLEHIAVAVDTSGSCSGEVMEGFLSELLAVLRDGGGPKLELTLIQCDAAIQSVETLSAEDVAGQIAAGMTMSGWGGTDFRPVFDYVNAARESADGVKFAGLIYFTDGWGDYPEQRPDYPVAFFFPRGSDSDWDSDWGDFGGGCGCPDWITKVYITPQGELQVQENEGGDCK